MGPLDYSAVSLATSAIRSQPPVACKNSRRHRVRLNGSFRVQGSAEFAVSSTMPSHSHSHGQAPQSWRTWVASLRTKTISLVGDFDRRLLAIEVEARLVTVGEDDAPSFQRGL